MQQGVASNVCVFSKTSSDSSQVNMLSRSCTWNKFCIVAETQQACQKLVASCLGKLIGTPSSSRSSRGGLAHGVSGSSIFIVADLFASLVAKFVSSLGTAQKSQATGVSANQRLDASSCC